jgi:peptidyl-dipeptidase A
MKESFRQFVHEHVTKLEPLETRASEAWWRASTTGEPDAYRERADLQTRIEAVLSDREKFAALERFRESSDKLDPVDRRQLDLLYLSYLGRQCSPDLLAEIVERASDVEAGFATFRPEIDGRRLTQNDVEEILGGSTDDDHRRRAWEASKEAGRVVAEPVRALVRLRNRAAHELGFDDYYRLSLTLEEQSPEEIETLFDDLDRRTTAPYLAAKREIDEALSRRFGVETGSLELWHYHDPFFQEVPEPDDLDLDASFRDRDLLGIARSFFHGIGLDVAPILERSDVHERDGKNQHAFCIHIDRKGDVRVLLNLKPTSRWMSTVLHELGHGVYDRGIGIELPYVLRHPAHTFVTEGIAMLFGRMSHSASWLSRMGLTDGADPREREDRLRSLQITRQLVFARWCQVMVRFERALYADPEADLDRLWWDLVERYQAVSRPAGRRCEDWATKIHIVSTPVYYHNYVLGEMMASQLLDAVLARLGQPEGNEGALVGRNSVGAFLTDRVFSQGASLPWSDLVAKATGSALSVESFVRQFG